MIKLTNNDSLSFDRNLLSQGFESKRALFNDSFLVHFEEFSSNLYAFIAKDCTHELLCEMILEVKEIFVTLEEAGEEGGHLALVVTCSFPAISLEKLNEKTGFDSYLQEMLMYRFQLKILEGLLLFCEEKGASNLILTANSLELVYLEIFSCFFVSEEQANILQGEQTQIIIPTDIHTYDVITDFMDKIDRDFQKILWCDQNTNPNFRAYLKSNACL